LTKTVGTGGKPSIESLSPRNLFNTRGVTMPERLASAVATRRENEVIVSAAVCPKLHNLLGQAARYAPTVFLLSFIRSADCSIVARRSLSI